MSVITLTTKQLSKKVVVENFDGGVYDITAELCHFNNDTGVAVVWYEGKPYTVAYRHLTLPETQGAAV